MILSIVALLVFIALFVFIIGLVMTIVAFAMHRPVKRAAIIVIASLATSFVMLGIVQTINVVQSAQQEKAEKKQSAKNEAAKAKFDPAYTTITTIAYTNGKAAEQLGDKVQATWKAAIFEDSGALVGGKRYTDFNDAIRELIKNEASTVSKINSGEAQMKAALKVMSSNKKAGASDKLETATKIVDVVRKYDRTTTSPSGNLTTYSNNFSQQTTDLSDLLTDYFTS